MRLWKKNIAAVLGLVIVASSVCLLSGCGSSDAGGVEKREATLPVNVMVLKPVSSITQQREFTGTVTASRRTQLAFERSARLMEVLFDEGQTVAKNEVVARLDQRQLKVRLAELESRLKQQKAVLAELEAGPRAETIAATEAELAALQADVELRKATLKRSENLYARRATSDQALDEVRLGYKAAVARAKSLQRQLDELNAGTRSETVDAQKALVAATEAQLDAVKIDITDSELKAPFAGTIVRRLRDEGDLLAPQQAVFEILESGSLEARVGVPTTMINALRNPEYFVLESKAGELTGRLRNVVPQIDPATRTQLAVLTIDNSEASGVADGQLVRLKLKETIASKGFRVPVTALSNASRGLWTVFVFASDDGQRGVTESRIVEVLQSDGEWAVVNGAVYANEQIVVDGIHRIVPGQPVSLAKPTPEETE